MKENQTICQFLGITVALGKSFDIKNNDGHIIYQEYSDNGWCRYEHDARNNIVFYVDNTNFWTKSEYNEKNERIYFENSYGLIQDRRPKPEIVMTLQEIADKLGIPVAQLRIKEKQ